MNRKTLKFYSEKILNMFINKTLKQLKDFFNYTNKDRKISLKNNNYYK